MKETKKMTLSEYEKKYNKHKNFKAVKLYLFILVAAIGLIICACLFFVVLRLFEINKYAGYVGIGVSVLIFLLIYLVPVIKVFKTKSFMVDVDENNIKQAKKFNKKLRNDLADKIIDLKFSTTDNIYTDESVKELIAAREAKDDEKFKLALDNIYTVDVRKAAKKITREYALKVGVSTALSQSDKIDTLLVVAYNMNLIKDIIFLYGFRPSEARMAKIYQTVIFDALIAFGASNVTGKMALTVIDKIPVIGSVVDSISQGLINGIFTLLIGSKTRKYLIKEYKLQNVIDNIDEESIEEDEKEMMINLKDDIIALTKNKKVPA